MGESSHSVLVATYLEQRRVLVRFFTARLGSSAAAEDLVQEIYLKLVAMGDEAPVSNALAYLYRIGWNLMLDRRRAERRAAVRDADWTDSLTTKAGDATVSDEAPADAAVDARLRLARIAAALDDLPPQVREAFRRHKFDGLSHSEVAQAMGVSRSSVEKYISAALKHLLRTVGP